jgi:hypothetical protein
MSSSILKAGDFCGLAGSISIGEHGAPTIGVILPDRTDDLDLARKNRAEAEATAFPHQFYSRGTRVCGRQHKTGAGRARNHHHLSANSASVLTRL